MACMALSYSDRITFHGYLVYYVLSFKTRPTEASNAFPACLQDLQCLENSACFCRLLVPGKKGNKISGSSLRTCSCILSTHHHTNTFLNNINAFFSCVLWEVSTHSKRENRDPMFQSIQYCVVRALFQQLGGFDLSSVHPGVPILCALSSS